MFRSNLIIVLLVAYLGVCGSGVVRAQQTAPQQPTLPSHNAEEPVRPEVVAARRAAVRAQLEGLGQPDPQKTEQEETRAVLEHILGTLTALEEALQKQATIRGQLSALPQRLRELEKESEQRDARGPSRFPQVTEQLRDEYQARIQATQAEIQGLIKETVAGEVRIASLPKELERRTQARAHLEKELLAAQDAEKAGGGQTLAQLRTELLQLQLQLQDTEIETLKAERGWLIRRIPLQDAQLRVAQVRLEKLQQDLAAIKQALGQAIQQEQATLSDTAADIAQQMEQTMDPTNALVLGISLETVEIRRATADYRQQLNDLGEEVLAQEKQNAQVKQNVERLTALVEKYASGEVPAQRLVTLFERLQRERTRYRDTPVAILQAHLRVLNEQLFTLDDQLYEFDDQAQRTLADLTTFLQDTTPEQRDVTVTEVRQLMDEQKSALRDQQQVLAALIQEVTRLLTLHREYTRQLEESYFLALNKMFWLRDGEPLNWSTLQDLLTGIINTGRRLSVFAVTLRAQLHGRLWGDVRPWVGGILLFLVLPAVAYRVYLRLRALIPSFLADSARRGRRSGGATAALIALRSAIWPVYISLIAWVYEHFLLGRADPSGVAAVRGLQLGAFVLWLALLGRGLLRRGGWAEQFLGLSRDLCRSLRRAITALCVAAVGCLVPRYILLASPGGAGTAAGSLALARFLLLVFQGVTLVVVGVLGRRESSLMQAVLAESRSKDGLLWRIRPFLHLALLSGLAGIMVLDVLGYRYAAQFLWERTLWSLLVISLLGLFTGLIVPWALQRLSGAISTFGQPGGLPDLATEESAGRSLSVLHILSNIFLVLLALGGILEVWGVSVSWVLTLPAVSEIFTRVLIIALVVGLTLVVLQISKTLTDYLLQPRATRQGVVREASRKMKTLAPLVQTLIRAGAIFVAVLVILEQLGIATAPVLAGVGIFGLAVGFASQSLIKDFINGLFILFEDSLSVGDIVTLRGIGGQVEKFTLRAVTLRDLSGNVHVIPNSSFDMVTNLTKDYSRYVLDIRVAYREDVDTVIAILQEIDEAMRNDPVYGLDMLEPIEIMGVERFEDSAVIVRARLKTRPIQQWRIGREFQRRLKKVFDERGIEVPFPHRTLYWGAPKERAQPAIHVATENHRSHLTRGEE